LLLHLLAEVKNKLALNLLFTANGISGFAQGISMLAIPWYFANNTPYFNKVYGLITIGILFFGLYAGTLVDKYSRKANFLGNSLVCGFLLLAIAGIGFYQNGLNDVLVVAVFGITMLNYNIHYPTLYAFGQEISSVEDYAKVNSNIEIVGQSTSILSGGIAAVMLQGVIINLPIINYAIVISSWNIWEIFLLNAGTYFLAATLILFIKYQPKQKHAQHLQIFDRIKVGFIYLRQHPKLLIFGVFSYSVFAMLLVEIHAVLPAYVDKHLHEKGSVFAIADGIYALGALCAGLFVSKVFTATSTQRAVIILTAITAAIFIWAFAAKSVLVIYLVSLILGFTNAGIRVLRLTYLFKQIPNELMGRVNSIFNMLNILVRSIFIFLFSIPFFNFDNHIIWAFLIMAVFLLFSALVLMFNTKQSIEK
jgi:DHA3 family macrolide efflux protein-like MFS transporter